MINENRERITKAQARANAQRLNLSTNAIVFAGLTAASFIRLGHSNHYARINAKKFALITDQHQKTIDQQKNDMAFTKIEKRCQELNLSVEAIELSKTSVKLLIQKGCNLYHAITLAVKIASDFDNLNILKADY